MFRTSTRKKPAVAGGRAMVVESLERREMFSATYAGEIIFGADAGGGPHLPVSASHAGDIIVLEAGPGGGPHVKVQQSPAVSVAYKSPLGVVVDVVFKVEPPAAP